MAYLGGQYGRINARIKRTCRCAEVTKEQLGSTITLMGWVQKSRNKGGIIFVDLRDRSGIMQVIFENSDIDEQGFEKAARLRSEFVIAVTGKLVQRSGAVNANLKTGEYELRANYLRILSEAETPPFPIEENSKTKEELRLKYRYLDLRRPDIQRNLMMRSKVAYLTREFMANEGFLEIETPMLGKSTPEGARDYLVPSRVHPGAFMHCRSHRSCLSSFLCARDMTDISRSPDALEMRISVQTDSRNLLR